MRCFIAIDVTETLRKALDDFLDPLRNLSRNVKWVAPRNIHLTLKFLGEVAEHDLPGISKALSDVASGHGHFSLTARGSGAFPTLRKPQVLWVGLDKSGPLADLFRDVDSAMAGLGFRREDRHFSPHLTVGRVRDGHAAGRIIDEFDARREAVFGTIDVEQFSLKQSILKSAGPEYRDLFVFTLCRRNHHE